MGICQNKSDGNKPQKQYSKELVQMFQSTKQLQEKFMKEVYDQEKPNESKNFNNIKTTQVLWAITQSVDLVNNSTHYQRRKGVSVNRMAMSNMQKGINLIADKHSNNPKDSHKQKYHKVIGLLLSHINLGKMTILENNETHQLVICETLKKDEENHYFLQWLKQKNIEHDNIISIQEIQSSDHEYQIIYEFWQDQAIFSKNEQTTAIILYQMFEAIEYLHENDLRYSSLTFDSFRFQNNKQNSIIKLTSLRNIYELPPTTLEILKYSPPDTYKYPPNRSKPRDIWSLGIIGLQLLLGQFPFLKKEQLNQKRQVLAKINSLTTEKIDVYLDKFNKDLKQLFLGMLQIDQTERYTINQCKTNPFIHINLTKYIENLITPIKSFSENHLNSVGKSLARFHLIRKLDNKQFVTLHNLFQEIDTLKTGIIGTIQIRDYYDQIYQPATIKSEIQEYVYTLPKNFEISQKQFIGSSCNLAQELLEKYYKKNIHKNLSIRENIKLLQLNECRMIEKDFSKNEIAQKLSFDLFLKYII